MTGPTHLVVGPRRHGVVTYALNVADVLGQPVVRIEDWSHLDSNLDELRRHTGGVHLNFTDRLFGASPGDAADRVADLASAGARLTVTLHDVPQAVDGGNYRQRTEAYGAVCDAVHGVATNSDHERSLLGENGITDPADVVVIPLPLDLGATPPRRPAPERCSVAVLGFVYPGKGHAEVISAMAGLAPDAEFLAIGECSPGHEDLAGQLAAAAAHAGLAFAMTGYLPDRQLSATLHRVAVPVAAHRHVSASGSMNTWIAAHRRPLVPENRYSVEHAGRHPGTVRLYPDTHRGLVQAIDAALTDPGSTWLGADAASGSTMAEVARRYAEAFARWHG
ncbi:glycosyltransferase family protein [Mycobacterium antarcticum]|uniref:hypothetical protein n=1 Tax=unclassified Mycolicibacterium TaxID=2636767 RepID=UPI0024E14C4E|nr:MULTISPECIES: hypothetical protein [unclassified Mycolicibacterium]